MRRESRSRNSGGKDIKSYDKRKKKRKGEHTRKQGQLAIQVEVGTVEEEEQKYGEKEG